MFLQSNLSIADMLHNRPLVIAETFLRNWPNHSQILIEKPQYSRHVFWVLREHFGQNLLLNSGHCMIGRESRKYMHVLFDTFLYFNIKLIIQFFQAIFHPCYNSCMSIKSHIIATAFLSFSLCSSCWQVNESLPIMGIHTSLKTKNTWTLWKYFQ